jgi:BirA family biotin operon repressor/biotin-[acetyl-CoA-carboxylase] ligase
MRIYNFTEIESTNDWLKTKNGLEELDTCIAEIQTKGRGRRGKAWDSNAGGAWFSFAVKDRISSPEEYGKIPLIGGLAVCEAIDEIMAVNSEIKWVNDVYIGGKKAAGILVEKSDDYFIVGIGINVNNKPSESVKEFAVSLFDVTGKQYEVDKLIKNVIEKFINNYYKALRGEWDYVLGKIRKRDYLNGKEVYVITDGGQQTGKAAGIDEEGKLIVEILNERTAFINGEVSIKTI